MPSRNVACRLIAGTLRCDILSGLRPEPGGGCDFDWVGLTLGKAGAATPLCGSDTVYRRRAPTLAYGETWRRGGIECTSRRKGLVCTNRDGHGLTLARKAWTVS
ncbi:MAG TPA: DUF6636 domain-containing protein [Gaiellaceae bacterium]|nr:DUF6636 domain-containing protein [Gaiellaceae bacterium]